MAPKVSGFTICRNSVKLGFPFLESLRSLAPICDEIIVALDDTGDGTREAIEACAKHYALRIRIVDSKWDLANMKNGAELARQTDIALAECKNEIVFYLQSDEVLHEDDYPAIQNALAELESSADIASVSLKWVHFYGDAKSVVHSRKWYRREVRAFKKSSGLQSYRDAQSFRLKKENAWERLPTLLCNARVFHYGYLRPPHLMATKTNDLKKEWTGSEVKANAETVYHEQYGIAEYRGSHPAVMRAYLQKLPPLDFPGYELFKVRKFKAKYLRYLISDVLETLTDWRPGEFKNYSKIVHAKN